MSEKLVKSAVRVLDIFEAFEAEQRPLTISNLVDLLQIPQSSMSTLIKSLMARGFVEYDAETRRYRPAVRLAFLGSWALGETDIIARLHLLAQGLHDETGETVLIGAENGLHMQYLSLVAAPQNVRFALHPGLKRPIHLSGLGIMLLSMKDNDEIGRLVRRYNAELSDPGEAPAQLADVEARVQTARQQGWYFSSNLVTRGGGAIATLLPLPCEQQTLAIGIGGQAAHLGDRLDDLSETLLRNVTAFRERATAAP